MLLEKIQNQIIKFGVLTRNKYQLQKNNSTLKRDEYFCVFYVIHMELRNLFCASLKFPFVFFQNRRGKVNFTTVCEKTLVEI
jgi:hypothetical protein